MLDLKFFDEYYVGFQKQRYDKGEQQGRILGFATHNTGDKAFEKRKETVDYWADKKIPTIMMKNVPMGGFKIVDAVSRSYNDNKLFRVEDPRGFELEIDAHNLFHIIEEQTIVKGVIIDEMLWARKGQSNYLISKMSPEYQQHLNGTFTTEHVPGTFYMNKVGNIAYRFEGKFHQAAIKIEDERIDRNDYGYWSYNKNYDPAKIHTNLNVEVDNRFKEKMFVYTEFKIKNGEIDTDQLPVVHLKKAKLKDLLASKKDFKSDFVMPAETYIPGYISQYYDKGTTFELNSPGASYYILFNDLARAREEQFSLEIIENITKHKSNLEEKSEKNGNSRYSYYGKIEYLPLKFKK